MNSYQLVPLDERARDYLCARLELGKALSGKLLEQRWLQTKPKLAALLPVNAQPDTAKLYNFETGGVLPTIDPGHRDVHGNLIVAKPTSDGALAKLIGERSSGTFVIEDSSAERGDPFITKRSTRTRYVSNDVYWVVESPAEFGPLEQAILDGAGWLFVACLTRARLSSSTPEIVEAELEAAAVAAHLVVVDAFDGEGYVVAERPNVPLN